MEIDTFLKDLFIFHFCEGLFCIYVHVCKFMCTLSTCVCGDQKWKLDSVKVVDLEVTAQCGCWVLSQNPQQEQQMLLVTEPFDNLRFLSPSILPPLPPLLHFSFSPSFPIILSFLFSTNIHVKNVHIPRILVISV